jgi:hypothetical protein
MSTTFISPVGRLVQGSMTLQPKKDNDGKPVLDKETQQPVMECFIAIAVKKTDPALGEFYALFAQQARMSFPHLFDAQGNCTHPRFAWKIQDGDGVDKSGKSVKDKPGFAGHYIFKMATRYAPRCFHFGKYDPSQVIQNPDDVIKKGYWIRVSGTVDGNGVMPNNTQAVPGLYVSPNLVELIDRDEEIVSGPDAAAVFGAAPLPAGVVPMSTPPKVGGTAAPAGNGLTPPGLPGMVAAGPLMVVAPGLPVAALPAVASGLPPMPGAAGGLPPMPAAVVQFQMTASAQGATRERLHELGWTDDMLIAQGHMVKVA